MFICYLQYLLSTLFFKSKKYPYYLDVFTIFHDFFSLNNICAIIKLWERNFKHKLFHICAWWIHEKRVLKIRGEVGGRGTVMATNERITRFYFYPGHQKRFEGEMRFLLWIIIRLLCGRRRIGETVIYFSMVTGGGEVVSTGYEYKWFRERNAPLLLRAFSKNLPSSNYPSFPHDFDSIRKLDPSRRRFKNESSAANFVIRVFNSDWIFINNSIFINNIFTM